MTLRFRRFLADDRAIEGLPIRLVIAVVVGVAALGVMMNMISGIQGLATEELDVQPEPEVIEPDEQEIELTVVDTDGHSVADATVVVTGGSATLEEPRTAETGASGTANATVDPSLGPNAAQGTLEIQIKPPAGSEYTDERANTEILVVDG